MNLDIAALDGNAAAGRLGQLFAFEVTTARTTCGACGHEGPLAELRLYGRQAGIVLRCPRCEAVNIRMLEARRFANLDLSGLARISIPVTPSGG
jgi:Zn finger protein HypA/HybF involved in hydrogenase expression